MGIRQRGARSGPSEEKLGKGAPVPTGTFSPEAKHDEHDENVDWLERRERLVRAALEDEDQEHLGRIAALPGGFGSDELRKEAWKTLLRTRDFFQTENRSGHDTKGSESEDTLGMDSLATGLGDAESTGRGSLVAPEESPASQADPALSDLKPHPDENQVLLDTKRSFVSYPKGLPAESKLAMQADLQALIVHVLRLYPSLSYFQGFHDIMSVLYLTFIPLPPAPTIRSRSASIRSRDRSTSGRNTPFSGTMTPASTDEKSPADREGSDEAVEDKLGHTSSPDSTTEGRTEELAQADRGRNDNSPSKPAPVNRDTPAWTSLKQCAEVVSVCRVRDAMGSGMEPMMGMLKILQRLLHAADPELSRFSAAISPVPTLPFFALSWILCLFSHDIDTLEPVQRMFDFLLGRNPISAIYLAVAIMVAKKDQMFKLARAMGPEAEDDPSLLHPLFSRLPPLVADTPGTGNEALIAESEKDTTGQQSLSNLERRREEDERNPYDPIPVSRIFHITDDLLARYPWDGPIIRGKEIMGPGSVVNTYDNEHLVGEDKWTLHMAERMANKEVILPGATMPDEPEEEERPPRRVLRKRGLKRQQKQVALALGVVVVGLGIAVYGWRAGGSKAGWGGWWAAVLRSWVGKRTGDRGQGVLGRVEDLLLSRVRGIVG